MRPLIVAIDGPAGAGKSTVARRVAGELGLRWVDTGAIYRSLAWIALERGIALSEETRLAEIAQSLDVDFRLLSGENHVFVFGEDVTREIREPAVSRAASAVSKHPTVRSALLEIQRSSAREKGALVEGRDIGTVVFPNAQLKVFLDASAAERARRRTVELDSAGVECRYEEVLAEMNQRDFQDKNRETAPLTVASDALRLDSTALSIEEVVQKIVSAARELT